LWKTSLLLGEHPKEARSNNKQAENENLIKYKRKIKK